jgi:hypothetical protein
VPDYFPLQKAASLMVIASRSHIVLEFDLAGSIRLVLFRKAHRVNSSTLTTIELVSSWQLLATRVLEKFLTGTYVRFFSFGAVKCRNKG